MIALQRRAMGGSADCGDQMEYWRDDGRVTVCVVDGLGHGLLAKDGACKIISYVAKHREETPEKLFRGCDNAMRKERGGVMAVAWIDGDRLNYASVGNITGYLASRAAGGYSIQHLNMDRGMMGGGFKKLNIQTLTLVEGDLLIMHSDGVESLYNLNPWHPVLESPEELARVLLEDQGKKSDDACVLVYRHTTTQGEATV